MRDDPSKLAAVGLWLGATQGRTDVCSGVVWALQSMRGVYALAATALQPCNGTGTVREVVHRSLMQASAEQALEH